jgi:hypothetical protein
VTSVSPPVTPLGTPPRVRSLPLAVPAAVVGGPLLAGAAVLAWLVPGSGASTAAVLAVGLVGFTAATVALDRRPWLAPWPVLIVFATSAELRLRVSDSVGVLKDVIVLLLAGLLVAQLIREQGRIRRLVTATRPLAALGIVVALYLLDPAGGHGAGWLFGTRLLLESLALLTLGLLCAHPERTLDHLVRAVAVVLPFEAVFAWVQQLAGEDALVFGWGYQYGAQVRATSGGGLRTSGTFEDPFQLAALAILGLGLALFVASRRQATVLVVAAVAVLAATSVRTAFIQAGILLVIWAVRRGWWRQAVVLGGVGVVAVLYVLATTTSAVTPGAEEEPLLLTLNGRSTAWSLAVTGPESLLLGNGVGERGIGSTRAPELVSAAPAYDPTSAPPASFAGDPAFLDSAYAQVQSDIGIVGSLSLLAGLGGLVAVLARRTARGDPAAWAALAVLLVSVVDWVGRSSLASYTTGFLTLYVLGVLVARTHVGRR